MNQKELTLKPYHRATDEEHEARNCAEEYDLLVGPNGFECLLTDPEDRNWYRDGEGVIDELNRIHSALTNPQPESSDREIIDRIDDCIANNQYIFNENLTIADNEKAWEESWRNDAASIIATIRADERRKAADRGCAYIDSLPGVDCNGAVDIDVDRLRLVILGETTP
jgi:hypothetical protein